MFRRLCLAQIADMPESTIPEVEEKLILLDVFTMEEERTVNWSRSGNGLSRSPALDRANQMKHTLGMKLGELNHPSTTPPAALRL